MTTATTTTAGDATKQPSKPAHYPIRQRTGTAHRRLLSSAVDLDIDELYALSPVETVEYLAIARWGSSTFMPCAHCGTLDEHYWSRRELRWKCTGCGNRFSVTSATVFADHKLSLNKILRIVFQWSLPAAGKTAVDVRKEHSNSYRSAFVLGQKLREGLARGHNVGVLCGVQEMDGLDLNGKQYKKRRNVPQGGRAKEPKIPEELRKDDVDPETGEIIPKRGKTARQPEDRRLLLVMRQRGLLKKRGAVATRICIAMKEVTKTVTTMAQRYASAESHIMSDEDPAYHSFKQLFNGHDSVKHSETFSKPAGVNNNQAESFNRRMRRAAEGIYLSPSNKYLSDYGCEIAWREDMREPASGERLRALVKTVFSVGLSRWWRGYWQSHYREHEMLIEGPKEAAGRGKKAGAKPRKPK